MTKSTIYATAGVLQQPNGDILMTQRPGDKTWSGYWEFPGGKIESNETPLEALTRELKEEINISISQAKHLIDITYEYPKRFVHLSVFVVHSWLHEIEPLEGQSFKWISLTQAMNHAKKLPTTDEILKALKQQLG